MGEYFWDLAEIGLDLFYYVSQGAMSTGIWVMELLDGLLPSNVNWAVYWGTWPVEIINLANYVGMFECMFLIFSAYSLKYVWKLVF